MTRRLLYTIALVLTSAAGSALAAANQPAEFRDVAVPPQFETACVTYVWLCADGSGESDGFGDAALRAIAAEVNGRVNRSVFQVSDLANYGERDRWMLPANGRGDCEDIVMAKMLELLRRGVAPERLVMAVVRDRFDDNHAVLLVRAAAGDLVLDNLTSRILLADDSGYRFLAMQRRDKRSHWQVAPSWARDRQGYGAVVASTRDDGRAGRRDALEERAGRGD